MLDYSAIGRRIREERKLNKRQSQEAFAAALNLHQADISNLERAQKGSGIADLNRLSQIAGYLQMPLERLLFGMDGRDTLEHYDPQVQLLELSGSPQLKPAQQAMLETVYAGAPDRVCVRAFRQARLTVVLCRLPNNTPLAGPQGAVDEDEESAPTPFGSVEHQRYVCNVFYDSDVVATATFSFATVFYLMNMTLLSQLQRYVPFEAIDVTDPMRLILPQRSLYLMTEDGPRKQAYEELMWKRMEALRPVSGTPLVLMESLYVKEDYRRHGYCRLILDCLKRFCGEHMLWLNLEPTEESDPLELSSNGGHIESTPAQNGQINLNASIAEKLGLRIDSEHWARDVETVDGEGNKVSVQMDVLKSAYRLTGYLQQVIREDGDLMAYGRAVQRIVQQENGMETLKFGG